jgi:hypothetical protein
MSTCYISSGIELGCSNGIGSLQKIYIVGGATGDVSAVAQTVDGAITGSTVASGTTIYGFNIKRNTSSLVQEVQKNFENGSIFFNQVVTAVFYKYDQDKRNLLKILSQNDAIQMIAVDQNGVQYWLGQRNGMYLSGGDANSGANYADGNKFNFIFTGNEPEPANVIVGALSAVFAGANIEE